jgi:hypothetical protein
MNCIGANRSRCANAADEQSTASIAEPAVKHSRGKKQSSTVHLGIIWNVANSGGPDDRLHAEHETREARVLFSRNGFYTVVLKLVTWLWPALFKTARTLTIHKPDL